ncbi:MAG: hypothetical protein K0S40_96 [Actinomycetospora sp.]|nr:hypothetical protein [Actinomycetospora sp.]
MGIVSWIGIGCACWFAVSCVVGLVVAKVMASPEDSGERERAPHGWVRLRARAIRSGSGRRPRVPTCTATGRDRVPAADGRRRTGSTT